MIKTISGAGGGKGGGGGRAAQEAPNTLRSSAVVRVVEVISEGEIVGIAGGAKGIYLNDTPLQAADDSYNFPRAAWDYRVGLPNQDYMKGFSAVEAEVNVATAVTTTTPVTKTTTSPTIDAVKVTIQLPNGLYSQDTSTGDLNGSSVTFVIEKKLTSSGSWVSAQSFTIDGKTTSPYERQYRIDRPTGIGTWDIRVSRTTADSTSTAIRNATTFSRLTEIQEVKDQTTEYNDTAVVGLAIDAETVGNSVPNRSYLVKGIKVSIPTNYDPVTRVYTGTWAGTFTTAWTDNPAWILYDLLTNARYGLGEFITPSQVDKYSFYDAAVYNDVFISDGISGTEPRFTFNAVINAREDAFRILQTVAGSMRGTLVYYNGLITLLQDRPSSPVKLITKANVIEGAFDYKSSGLFERHTAFNVTFNDRKDRHLQRVSTIDASTTTGDMQTALLAAQARYGYNPVDIAAYGATTESQAIRHGRWALDTELNQTEVASWKMSLNGFDLLPGDVVKVFDEDYTATVGGGRVVSVIGTTVIVDRPITLSSGSTIDVLLADGKTIETRGIVQTSGTTTTFTVSSVFSQSVLSGADYIVTTATAPRQFKIVSIKQEEVNIVSIEAILHDPNKYARVESGVSIPSPIFSNAIRTVTTVPTNLTFRESSVNVDNTIKRSLLISWGQPATGAAAYYSLSYRVNGSTWVTISDHGSLSYELINIQAGTYDVRVYAHSAYGNQSDATQGSYTITGSNGGVSSLNAPTTLEEQNGNGTAFLGSDLNFKWTNPASNATVVSATLRDFEVRIIETTGGTTLRTYYVPSVAASAVQASSYTYAMNLSDGNNVARRTIKVEVRCRDTNGNLSTAVQTTFTNSAPAVPSNIVVTGGLQSVKLTFTSPTDPDYAGVLIWGSTTTGFVPSAANLLYDGKDNYISFSSLNDVSTYYYKVASYDTFGKDYAGTGLNLSVQYSATTVEPPGIPNVATLPATAAEGDVVFNTTDGQLYRWHSGAWTAAVPAVNISGTLSDAQLAAISAAKVTGTITGTQITDGAISTAKLAAGAVTAGKITAGSITAGDIAAGTITGAKIATGTLTATNIAAGTLTATELAANTITGGKIAAGTISGTNIAAGTIAASNIVAGTITGDKIAAGTLTSNNIVSGTITTDKLVVGAASAVGANSSVYTAITPGNVFYPSITGGTVLTITTTGAPINVWVTMQYTYWISNPSATFVKAWSYLKIDGSIVATVGGPLIDVRASSEAAAMGSQGNFANCFRLVLAAGTHSFSVNTDFIAYDSASQEALWGTGTNSIAQYASILVFENKV